MAYDNMDRQFSTGAGWFPDPQDPTQQRYWDGFEWTEQRAPASWDAGAQRGVSGATYAAQNAPGATTSLVLGILSLALCGIFTGIPAMITARSARREIDRSHGRLGGRGLATAGYVTGLIGTIWSVLSFLLVIGVFAFGGVTQSQFESDCSEFGADLASQSDC